MVNETKLNPFERFSVKTKKLKIDALGGAEVVVKDLTIAEINEINSKVVGDVGKDGVPVMDIKKATILKYEKVSKMLVEPKIAVDDLLKLSGDAVKAVDEILSKATSTGN